MNRNKAPFLRDLIGDNTFRQVIKYSHKNNLSSITLYLPLVLSRKKCGMIGGSNNPEKVENVSDYLESLNIPYKIDSGKNVSTIYISYNKENLKDVDCRKGDKELGRFLGVPEKDNLWYKNPNNPDISESKPIPNNIDSDKQFDDIFYARLVSWICRPRKESLERTISIGKVWYDELYWLKEKHNIREPLEEACHQMERSLHPWYS